MLKDGPCEQYRHKEHGLHRVNEGDGPETKQLEYFRCWYMMFVEQGDGDGKADNSRPGHSTGPGAYRGGCIAGEGGRGASFGGQIEGYYVEKDVGSLQS